MSEALHHLDARTTAPMNTSETLPRVVPMAVPAFSDIAKPSNDVRSPFATVGTSDVIGNG